MKCPKCNFKNPADSKFCKECGTQLIPSEKISSPHTKTLETPKEELTTGSTFAERYQIIEELGKGGMGKVYKVHDTEIKEKVALKLLKSEIALDEKTIERFRNEIRLARKIAHKNVGRMFDLGKGEGTYFITMEYVSGQDLKGLIRQTGKLAIETTISIAKQVCEGLEEAHKQGVVHRDLKPSNIMIDREGNVRIMDFGIARSIKTKGLTGAGVMIGTPEYMSPEQAEAKAVDHRSDIYSLGIILYEMVTGMLPFEGDTPLSIAMKHKSEKLKAPKLLNPQIPDDLNSLILKCLEKSKTDRYQAAEEVSKDISGIEKKIPLTQKVVPKRRPATSKEITVKFNLKKAFLSALVVVILIAVAGYFLFRPGRPDTDINIGTTRQISHEPGLEIDPKVSPDGKMVAFVTGPLGKTRLVVRQVAGGRQIEVTQDFSGNQRWPQWSPDGSQLAFYSEGAIYVVPSLGGIPRRVVDKIENSSAHSPAWSPDGKKIAYVQNDSICVFTLDTEMSEEIVEAKEVHSLSWSPDGSQIAYVSGNIGFVFSRFDIAEALFTIIGNNAPSSIHIASLSRRTTVRVTSDDHLNASPVWTPEKKHILFISDRGGARDIYAVPLTSSGRPSGKAARLTTGLDVHTIGISRDGQKLVYSVFNTTANVRSIQIPEKGPLSISDSKPITKGNQIIETLDVSPDGQWLAYDSNLSGNADIYKMQVAGGEAIQLTTHPSGDFNPQWSPDGQNIAFHSFRQGSRDICLMTKDGRSIQVLTDDPSHEFFPDWSPDGLKIVFYSDKTGRHELFVVSKDETGWGKPELITSDGGPIPKWSPLGDYISYISEDRLRIISYADKKVKTLVKTQNTVRLLPGHDWSPDGKTIYYVAVDGPGNVGIWSVPVIGGRPEIKVIYDDPYLKYGQPIISTEGQRFYLPIRQDESNVWIMDLISRE
ncbi:MAG: protein kinase [Candidatus Aminicenantes bacterium]|nr:protein kinase [Candidatus Aminicenantes bacterium]